MFFFCSMTMKLFRDCLRLLEELQILNVTNARIPPKLFQNLASLKDFLTKYSKVIRVYTINANRGDQNPLDITLGQRAPFPNVFILDSVKVGTNDGPVHASTPCNKSREHRVNCTLFATKCCRSPATSPTN